MRNYRAFLICLVAACFFSYELVQLHMLNALAPHIMKDLMMNATQLSTLSSTYLLADVLFLIPAGMIIDRFSVRKVILFALGTCIIGTIGFAFSKSLLQACVFHFFSGIGNAFCFLSCMLLANGWFKDKSTFVMSFMITIGLLGGVIAQVPFSLLAQTFNWRIALLIDAVIGVLIWLLNYAFVFDALESEKQSAQRLSIKEVVTNLKIACKVKETWICGLYTGLMNLPLMIISAMVGSLFLVQVHHFKETVAGFVISMISLGTIIGSSFFGWMSEKLRSKKWMMMAGAFTSLVTFVFLLSLKSASKESMAVLFFMLGFFSATQVLGYPMITDASPQPAKGTAMGVSAVVIMGLAFILQPITGILLDFKNQGVQGYQYADFVRAFCLFPIAFFISLILSFSLKEKENLLSFEENGS
jgi:MFS family permease